MESAGSGNKGNITMAWLRWFLLAECLMFLLALAGSGHRQSVHRSDDHGTIARWFVDDPDYLDALLINFIAVNIFVWSVILLAFLVTRFRRKRGRRDA